MTSIIQTILKISLFFVISFCICPPKIHAQVYSTDRIVKKDSTVMFVFILNHSWNNVKYRNYGQETDSVHFIHKSEIERIILRNGYVYNHPQVKPEVIPDKVDSTKRPFFFPIYLDAAFGFTLSESTSSIADINFGFRLSEKYAIGYSQIAMSDYTTDAIAWGIQFRYTPKHFMFKFEAGKITKASAIDHSSDAIYTYLPQKSNNSYLRLSATVRVASILTLSLNYIYSGTKTFDIANKTNGTIVPLGITFKDNMGFLCPQIGISIPPMRSKKNKK